MVITASERIENTVINNRWRSAW